MFAFTAARHPVALAASCFLVVPSLVVPSLVVPLLGVPLLGVPWVDAMLWRA